MATTIFVNDGSSVSTSPTLILGYQTERVSQNIVHDLVGGGILISYVRPRPRSGTLSLFYPTEALANSAAVLFTRENSFTINDTDRSTINMTFVISGAIRLSLDDETRNSWVVDVDYQEVV